jgi:hypothetical protein
MNRSGHPLRTRARRRRRDDVRHRPAATDQTAVKIRQPRSPASVSSRGPRTSAPRPHHGRIAAALGMALLVALTGCTGASTDPPGSPPTSSTPTSRATTPTTSSPPTAATPQQQALVAYQAMWAAWVTAAKTSDAHTKTIGRHATGDALELILTSLAQDKQEGVVTRGQPVLNPHVQSATPASAPTHVTIVDCADASHWLKYSASTGKLKNDVPGGKHAVTAVVQHVGSTWMVVQFIVQSAGTC